MGFILFLLVTATLLIRPSEHLPELATVHIYEVLIALCFAVSISGVLEQFTLQSLESRPITVCMIGLLAAIVMSHLSNGNVAQAGETGLDFLKIFVYYILLVANVTTMFRLRVLLICLGCCAVAFVSVALLHYHDVITLPEAQLQVYAGNFQGADRAKGAFLKDLDYDSESGQMVEIKRLRGTGIYGDPNDLSLLLTTGLFVALWCLMDPKQGIYRLAWMGALVLFLYALVLTQSRGGLLGLLAGFMAMTYARFGWRGMLLLGAPALPIALVLFGGRMASISTSDGTGQLRIQVWNEGIAALISAPVFGIGMHELIPMLGRVAHNSYVGAYAELGIFGGTMFLGAFFIAVLGMNQLIKYPQWVVDPNLRQLLPYLAAVLISYAVGIMSLSRVDAVPTYLVLGMVAAALNIAALPVPALTQRLDGRLVQRLALASVAFLAVSYVFVRMFRA